LRDKYQERYTGFPIQRVWGSSIIPLKREVVILYYKLISIKVVQSLTTLSS